MNDNAVEELFLPSIFLLFSHYGSKEGEKQGANTVKFKLFLLCAAASAV